MTTTISTAAQAGAAGRQLEQLRSQITSKSAELDATREQLTTAIMAGRSTVDLLVKRSRTDSDLAAYRHSASDLEAALEAWHLAEQRRKGDDARRALEEITAEGREIERQYVEVMGTVHGLPNRLEALRGEHHRAMVRARDAGALGPDYGTGAPVSPAPHVPRVHRPMERLATERMPANLPKLNISLDEMHAARMAERMGA